MYIFASSPTTFKVRILAVRMPPPEVAGMRRREFLGVLKGRGALARRSVCEPYADGTLSLHWLVAIGSSRAARIAVLDDRGSEELAYGVVVRAWEGTMGNNLLERDYLKDPHELIGGSEQMSFVGSIVALVILSMALAATSRAC